jgi:hypothetical protein
MSVGAADVRGPLTPDPQPQKARGNTEALAPYRIKPGQVLNPSGRPKTPAAVREAALALTPAAIRVLGEIMQDKKAPPATRVTAADKILDRALGRPAQTVDVHTTKHDALAYSIAELVAIAYKQGLDGNAMEGVEPPTDVTPPASDQ